MASKYVGKAPLRKKLGQVRFLFGCNKKQANKQNNLSHYWGKTRRRRHCEKGKRPQWVCRRQNDRCTFWGTTTSKSDVKGPLLRGPSCSDAG